MHPSFSTRQTRRQSRNSTPLLPATRTPPRAIRAKVAIVDGRGLVLGIVGTIAEARGLLAGGVG